MDKLFELSAELTLDAAAFLRALAQAEQAARSATATLTRLQAAANGSWSGMAASIQAATEKLRTFLSLQGGAAAPGFATGINYVPYNDFPARLHEGEAVLTSLEAAQWRNGQNTSSPDLSGLQDVLAAALSGVTVQLDGQTVGQLITPAVSREIAQQTKSRRYTA